MIKSETQSTILENFASKLDTQMDNWTLTIPEKFGRGYCSGYVFNNHIRMFVFNYELYENLEIKNPDVGSGGKTILFKFQNVFTTSAELQQLKALPSVLIATMQLNGESTIPIHSNASTINIQIDAGYLSSLFDLTDPSPLLQGLISNTQPLLFEQIIYPSLQKIVTELVSEPVDEVFKLFFLRVKAEELICRLLIELEERDTKQLYALKEEDIQRIYAIRTHMLESLDTPPVIDVLAGIAGMSATKLKRLFKQIFGNSIFNYYQEFRMKEAASLLKNGTLSVSEVGYQLGFSNLSHFSKVFKAHLGMKPKQYSLH